MSNLFRNAHPALKCWIMYHAAVRDPELGQGGRYLNTIIRLVGHTGEAIGPSPFLCMVSFGFSPISRRTDPPSLLPGFDDATIRNLNEKTPLHVACQAANAAIVEDLLELEFARRGSCLALLTMEDSQGQIPLHFARNDKVVEILLQYEMKDSSNMPPAHGPRTSRILHWKNKSGKTPFQSGICSNCSQDLMIQILDHYTVETQALDYIYRHTFVMERLKIVTNFIDRGALHNVNLKSLDRIIPALIFAINTDDTPLAKSLLDHKACLLNSKEVGHATYNDGGGICSLKMLELLLSKGAAVDARGPRGWTPLFLAVKMERIDAVKYLVGRSVEVYPPRDLGCTSLARSARVGGNTKMVGLLLDYGADINGADELQNLQNIVRKRSLQVINHSATHSGSGRMYYQWTE